ncbi:MAG: ABC transporter ATP-binding protein [Bacteroidales bacterium]|nr:ABC transporter ATP-binding protein [Bacteroidales bacterium]
MASDSILEIRNLTKNYGSLKALDGLNLHVKQGEIYGLLGPNGSGKTTTLSIVMGVLKKTAGDYYWFNRKPHYTSRLKIGSLIEDPHFYPYLTLYENLKIITRIKEIPESQINYSLGITGLLKRKYSKFRTLSSGLKQRLAIAAVLAGDPEVLVLDEPTKSLDPEGFSDLRDIIQKEAEKGKTIVLSSHILDEVEKVCTHVGILKSGELVTQGKVEDILSGKEVVFIASENPDKTSQLLYQCPFIEKFEKLNSREFKLLLNKKGSPVELNKYFFDQGIVLSKLVKQKNTLESEFLQLMK